ncbi:MAG: LuxR family transcriptional regulator [Pseudomonadota bacterium]
MSAEMFDHQLTALFEGVSDDLETAIFELRDRLGVKHLVYHAARFGAKPVEDPFVRLTYPAEWVHRYLTRNYLRVDPVIREGFQRSLPFNWAEVGPANQAEVEFFKDALTYDIGSVGFSIPLRDKFGRRALLSLASDMDHYGWAEICQKNRRLWIDAGNILHQMAAEEMATGTALPPLSPREREVLYWCAQGKTAAEIGLILNLATYTVSTYLRSARYKTNSVSITQAVYKAQNEGIIEGQYYPEKKNIPI